MSQMTKQDFIENRHLLRKAEQSIADNKKKIHDMVRNITPAPKAGNYSKLKETSSCK